MHMTEGISWVLPTVMSNKVCCEMPTPPLCCDTASCQKILKSLHELGDGSCNYLSYCLAAAALPRCCWPPLRLVLHLFALSLATRPPGPPRGCRTGGGLQLLALQPNLAQFLGEVVFLLARPQAWFCMGQLHSKEPWTSGWHRERRARAPRRTHQMQLFVFVCVAFFPFLLAPGELEQYRQLQALPVLHLLPKTSSK